MKQAFKLALQIKLLRQAVCGIIQVHFLPLSCMLNHFGEIKVL
jgi:hypothetical protein